MHTIRIIEIIRDLQENIDPTLTGDLYRNLLEKSDAIIETLKDSVVLPYIPTEKMEDAMSEWLYNHLGMDASITQFGRLYRSIIESNEE